MHIRFVFRWDSDADVILCDQCDLEWRAHGLERPVDCVVPVSSSTSLRAMAKAMKKAAAEPAPAMKKGMRRAMKAMKAVNTQAKALSPRRP